MPQFTVPCAVYRGGTSRGLFFDKEDLPKEHSLQQKIFMTGIDAYNPSQINGLGSGTSHTSKVCVISKSNMKDVDVDFTFYQIGIGEEVVDDKGTCGNLMAAVGSFAIDKGLVVVAPTVDSITVRIYNTNIKKTLHIKVPIVNGQAKVTGDLAIPGIVQKGAKYDVAIINPGGSITGKTLPIGTTYSIKTQQKEYEISFVDVVNPFVFISANELGKNGTESLEELKANKSLLQELEEIRLRASVASGMAKTIEDAKKINSVPKIAIVSSPIDYPATNGKIIEAKQVDIVAKMISMGSFHRTFAGSGLYCLAAAILLKDTIPNHHFNKQNGQPRSTIRVGHPEGIVEVKASLKEDGNDILSVGLERTARRIIEGKLFIPED